MSQSTPFFRRLGSHTTTASSSSTSSTSSNSFRAAYTLDNCGHDLSYTYSAPKQSEVANASNPFRRAAYTLDGQGYDLSSTYPYAAQGARGAGDAPPSQVWSMEQKGFRSLYTLDWKPFSFPKKA